MGAAEYGAESAAPDADQLAWLSPRWILSRRQARLVSAISVGTRSTATLLDPVEKVEPTLCGGGIRQPAFSVRAPSDAFEHSFTFVTVVAAKGAEQRIQEDTEAAAYTRVTWSNDNSGRTGSKLPRGHT